MFWGECWHPYNKNTCDVRGERKEAKQTFGKVFFKRRARCVTSRQHTAVHTNTSQTDVKRVFASKLSSSRQPAIDNPGSVFSFAPRSITGRKRSCWLPPIERAAGTVCLAAAIPARRLPLISLHCELWRRARTSERNVLLIFFFWFFFF